MGDPLARSTQGQQGAYSPRLLHIPMDTIQASILAMGASFGWFLISLHKQTIILPLFSMNIHF
jgi:hypothetical protein